MDPEHRNGGQGSRSRPNTRAAAYELSTEPFPDWLHELESKRLNEYVDVNEAEKRLMLMWNLHVSRSNVTGDVHIPLVCRRFVELHGGDIARGKLYRNLCLHIANLYNFGLLSMDDVRFVIEMYHSQRKAEVQPMEVTGDEDVKVKKPHKTKRKSSEVACTNERSPLKKLSSNLEETEDLDFTGSPVFQPVPHRNREPSSTSKSEVIPSIVSPPDTKYKKKNSKREKFPSFDY